MKLSRQEIGILIDELDQAVAMMSDECGVEMDTMCAIFRLRDKLLDEQHENS